MNYVIMTWTATEINGRITLQNSSHQIISNADVYRHVINTGRSAHAPGVCTTKEMYVEVYYSKPCRFLYIYVSCCSGHTHVEKVGNNFVSVNIINSDSDWVHFLETCVI